MGLFKSIKKANKKTYRKLVKNINKSAACLSKACFVARQFLNGSSILSSQDLMAFEYNLCEFREQCLDYLYCLVSGEVASDYERIEIRTAIDFIADLEIRKELKEAEYKKLTDEKEKISCKRDLIKFELELKRFKKKIFSNE